ncbi:eukaryotic aspartyl protease domain-containing protein [Ditylenchus destructor]|nr:eukaryotic aspartyl protease domain-containing protein [Ditylenchus destructor]
MGNEPSTRKPTGQYRGKSQKQSVELNDIGLCLFNKGNFEDARIFFHKSVFYEKCYENLVNLAKTNFKLGRYQDAYDYASLAISSNPRSEEAYLIKVQSAVKLERMNDAFYWVRIGIQKCPHNDDLKREEALICFQKLCGNKTFKKFVSQGLSIISAQQDRCDKSTERRSSIDLSHLSSSLSCPICCMDFSTPRALICGHIFCQRCIDRLTVVNQHFECPMCRVKVHVDSNRVRVYVLERVLESVKHLVAQLPFLVAIVNEQIFNKQDYLNILVVPYGWIINGAKVQVPMHRENEDYYPIINITLGSPPQYFRVALSLYERKDLELLSVCAESYRMAENKSLFNSSASSTYKEHTNSSYNYYMGYGHLGEDLLGIADTLFNITFSLIESPSFSWLYTNVDGYLGLATGKLPGRSETIPLVKQLEKDLDNPVISVWKQQLNNDNASYILTLGAYDTTNCENAWNNVPRLTAPDTCFGKTTAATVHVNSITTTFRGNDVRIALNKSMIIDQNCIDFYGHNYLYGFMPYYIKFLFTSAVKARLSNQVSITSSYAVDCDVEVVGNLTLHIGDWSSNKRMSLNGADLTDFLEEDIAMILVMLFACRKWPGTITVMHSILQRMKSVCQDP